MIALWCAGALATAAFVAWREAWESERARARGYAAGAAFPVWQIMTVVIGWPALWVAVPWLLFAGINDAIKERRRGGL